jgi:hypothetical protein
MEKEPAVSGNAGGIKPWVVAGILDYLIRNFQYRDVTVKCGAVGVKLYPDGFRSVRQRQTGQA